MAAIVTKITVQLDDGTMLSIDPSRHSSALATTGANPRFYAAQVDEQLSVAAGRLRNFLSTYGPQRKTLDPNDDE